MKRLIFIATLIGFTGLSAQAIFPGQSGTQLLNSLVSTYKPTSLLSLSATKDTMYAVIFNQNDSLSCVYTGFTMYIDPSLDPSQAAFQNGSGINQEHMWPRSKGADGGNPEKDMHHLRPTRVEVNSARSSYDFDEIPDTQTDRWYRNSISTAAPPYQNRDEYSELDTDGFRRFEPREDYKGNVARAMFYFYTMYKADADNSGDPGFFNRQKDVWRSWNAADPVDQEELDRTWDIAGYQSGQPNPFVLDTSLIGRAYFGVVTGIKDDAQGGLNLPEDFQLDQNYPNPFNPETTISFRLQSTMSVNLAIYDMRGGLVRTLLSRAVSAGSHSVVWDGLNNAGDSATSGVYIYRLTGNQRAIERSMILLR